LEAAFARLIRKWLALVADGEAISPGNGIAGNARARIAMPPALPDQDFEFDTER